MLSPLTRIVYSVKPNPMRPVGVCVAGTVPLNRSVPPLPLDTPDRISYAACVAVKPGLIRLFEYKLVTFQPVGLVTLKSANTCASVTIVCNSFANPFTRSASPLYHSGPEATHGVGVAVPDGVGVDVAGGVGVAVGQPTVGV